MRIRAVSGSELVLRRGKFRPVSRTPWSESGVWMGKVEAQYMVAGDLANQDRGERLTGGDRRRHGLTS